MKKTDTQLTELPAAEREKTEETEGASLIPDETVEIPDGVEGRREAVTEERVTSEDDPFPPDGAGVFATRAAVPRGSGRIGKYIFFLICAVFGAVTVIVVGAGIGDSVSGSLENIPRIFYSGILNSGFSEIPKAGEGRMLSGRIVTPPAPSVAGDGSVDPPGALEPDGDERAEGGEEPTDLPIMTVDLSCGEKDGYGLINATRYRPDPEETAARGRVIPVARELYAEYGEDAPLVLIIHTHGTECYSPDGAESYPSDRDFRSLDPEDGVVSVGEAVKRTLEARGIGTIHVTDMFDAEDFLTAYTRSAEKVRGIMRENPSVRYVVDVHRDALITEEGVNLRPVTEFGGKDAAQLMTVIGTDEAGSGHGGWRDNLSLALFIQKKVGEVCPGLMRAVNLRRESFNQQLSPGYLLLEAGTAANSLAEAERGAVIYADALAEYINGGA